MSTATMEPSKEEVSQYYSMNIESPHVTVQQQHQQAAAAAADSKSDETWNYVLFISVFAVLGSCLRVYMARFFGEDCEYEHEIDILMPFYVCVTASGRTEQTGGALFYDLPANLLGSFFMGLITPCSPDIQRLPFLGKDHPLQKDSTYHTGLGVGLCGSLTTFASWNSQMIIMIDGNYTFMGPQMMSALFGYMIGLFGAIESFRFGRCVAMWWCHRKNAHFLDMDMDTAPTTKDQFEDEPRFQPIDQHNHDNHSTSTNNLVNNNSSNSCEPRPEICCCPPLMIKVAPFILVVVIILFYFIGYILEGIHFYRLMFAKSMVAPIGALLRWKLGSYNSSKPFGEKWAWVPAGTLFANVFAATVAIITNVYFDRFHNDQHVWLEAIIYSIRVGFTGCLSTVSTFIKEIVLLSEKYPEHAKAQMYGSGTILVSIIICLPLYSIIGRVGQ